MAIARFFTSLAQPTALSGGISNTNLTIQVQAVTGFPTSYPYTLALDYGSSAEELVDVTGAAGLTLTVTRGVDGTSAQSHSIGAVVRHTSSGRDFNDLQGHIAATSGVHGISGTLVGTSDAQTLANKTLTSPSISGATLSGTLSGSPTFSGNPTFSGTPVLSTGAALTGTVTGAPTFSGGPSFSTARPLFTRAAAANAALGTRVTADTVDRLEVDADGKHLWGTGAAAADTNLYRNAVGELKTDTALTVAGALSAGSLMLPGWSTWTPTWSTTTGLHVPAIGNGSVTGASVKLGRLLVFSVGIAFGSTTTFGSGATTADNWSWSLPGGLSATATFAGAKTICGFGRITQSTGGTVPVSVLVDGGANTFTLVTAGGRQDGASFASTSGIVDASTPWVWAAVNEIAFFGCVETTT